jgi:hypothetical protein
MKKRMAKTLCTQAMRYSGSDKDRLNLPLVMKDL